jgi:hypothetical protein
LHTRLHSDIRLKDVGFGYKISATNSSYSQFDS